MDHNPFRYFIENALMVRRYAQRLGYFEVARLVIARLPLVKRALRVFYATYVPAHVALKRLQQDDRDDSGVLVSVLIPVHNGVKDGLERLLQSIRNQTHKNIEIIAVNTESTDDSVALLERYGARVFHNAMKDFGHDRVRNMAAEAAKGDYFLFTVCDACFDQPDWIARGLKTLRAWKGDSYSTPQRYGADAEPYARIMAYNLAYHACPRGGVAVYGGRFMGPFAYRLIPYDLKIGAIHVDDVNHLIRRETFLKLKYRTHTCEDMDFGRRLILSGGRFIHSSLSSVLHYHSYANTKKYFTRVLIDLGVINKILFKPLSRNDPGFIDAQVCAGAAAYKELRCYLDKLKEKGVTNFVFPGVNPVDRHARPLTKAPNFGAEYFINTLFFKLLNRTSPARVIAPVKASPAMEALFGDAFGLTDLEKPVDSGYYQDINARLVRALRANMVILSKRLNYVSMPFADFEHVVTLTFIAVLASTLSFSLNYVRDDASANAEVLRKYVWQ